MPVEPIKYVSRGDSAWTMMHATLANWVISRLNVLFCKVTVKPDGAGKWEAGEEGIVLTVSATGTASVTHPYQTYENGSDASTKRVSVRFGAHGDEIIPTINGSDPIDSFPAPIIDLSSGSNYIYAKLSTDSVGTLTTVDISRYSGVQTSVDPNGNGTDGEFYQLISLPTVTGSTLVVNQNVSGSQAYQYCNGGMLFGLV
jgi:hypothetical protein